METPVKVALRKIENLVIMLEDWEMRRILRSRKEMDSPPFSSVNLIDGRSEFKEEKN